MQYRKSDPVGRRPTGRRSGTEPSTKALPGNCSFTGGRYLPKLTILIFLAVAFSATTAFAGDYIRLGIDSIEVGTQNAEIPFYLERTCPTPTMIMGIYNGFEITTTGDASYEFIQLVPDPVVNSWFNLGGLLVSLRIDGNSPDSFLVGAAAMPPAGMPIVTDRPFFTLIMDIGPGEGEICIDSAFVFAAGQWIWSGLTCGQGGAPNRPLFVDKYGNPSSQPLCIRVYEKRVYGDVNCDGIANITDAVYLIQWIFGGGPPPGDPDDDGVPDC